MKDKYLLVWEDDNHVVKTKSADTLLELYRYALQNQITGDYFKQIQVKVIEG